MTDVIERLRTARDHTDTAPPLDLDVVRSRARTRLARRRIALASTLSVALLGAIATATTLPQRINAVPGDGTGVPAFDRAQQLPEDTLPSLEPIGDLVSAVDPASTRLIVDTDDVQAWVFRLQDGHICVVVRPTLQPDSAGTTCTTPTDFREHQLRLGLTDPATIIEILVAPVDQPEPPNTGGLDQVADGVWVSFSRR